MAKEKHRICTHCEGRISVEADTCLYCGMPLVTENAAPTMQESMTSAYSPYGQKSSDYMKLETEFSPKFKTPVQREDSFAGISSLGSGEAAVASSEVEGDKSGFIALLLALLGSSLLILGLMQGLFSDEGFLRLEWNCKYWFLFCMIGVPMIYFGIKKSKVS